MFEPNLQILHFNFEKRFKTLYNLLQNAIKKISDIPKQNVKHINGLKYELTNSFKLKQYLT